MKVPSYPMPPRAMVTRAEAAELLGCSLRTVSRYQQAGRLRFNRHGRRTMIFKEDVVEMNRPDSSVRVDNQRVRHLMGKLLMLEMRMAEVIEAMDAHFLTKTTPPDEQTA